MGSTIGIEERVRRALGGLTRQLVPLTLLALAAGVAAQVLLDRGERLGLAGALYALAALLTLLLYGRQALERPEGPAPTHRRRIIWWLVLAALVLGALAWPRFANNQFSGAGTALWAGGLLLLALAVWPASDRAPLNAEESAGQGRAGLPLVRLAAHGIVLDWGHLALLGILLIGAFYRFYRIDQIPLEMGCDLPHNYNNIRMILRHEFPVFFASYPGREGLFFYLAAPFCDLFGLSHVTIKMAGSLVGLATLPVIYLLGKELYDRRVGLIAAFFLSVSHWHIIIGRVGYRAITVPLVLGLLWYVLIRALRTQRPHWYALAGLFLGLGLYTYNAFMIVPALVLVMLLTAFVTKRGRALLKQWPSVVLLFVVALYVFLPEGRYAYEQPNVYFYRAATRITGLESALPGDMLRTLLDTTRRGLLMFNYRGDGVFISNVPYLRELGLVTALFFVIGLAHLLWRWRRGYNLTVLAALGVMLLPTILALAFPHEVPNAVRSIGALPAAILVAAVGLDALWRGLAEHYAGRAPREVRIGLSLGEQGGREAGLAAGAPTPSGPEESGLAAGGPADAGLETSALATGAPGTTGAPSGKAVSLRLRWSGRWLWLALLVFALGFEVQAVYPVYFHDYPEHLPSRNYAISLEIAHAIDAFYGNGESYAKVWPYWYDGNAVRALLEHENQSWANELVDLLPDRAPLAGSPGKFMVILHPDDTEGLAQLQALFPRGIALQHTDYDGRIAFITFYGERQPV